MKCLFCNKCIPLIRLKKWTKYCSEKCNKRSWYLKHNPKSKSYLNNNPEFWKTETGKGFYWEKWSAKLLGAKHLEFNKNCADLNWNGKLVDVKSSNIYLRKFAHGRPVGKKRNGLWVFHRNNNKPMDFFFCICLNKDKIVKKYMIPNSFFPKAISIGKISKYDKFLFS
jgi:hypothetical protein